MRLIDADELLAQMIGMNDGWFDPRPAYDYESLIKIQPTVDAAPMKHGNWEEPQPEGVLLYDKRAYAQRSVCKNKSYLGWKDNYCRHCGAKMDLGGIKMPIYRRGNCYTCGEESEYLLPEIGFERENRRFVVGLLCPKCRDLFRKMRVEMVILMKKLTKFLYRF